jgi:hypothetical protein
VNDSTSQLNGLNACCTPEDFLIPQENKRKAAKANGRTVDNFIAVNVQNALI